MRYNKGLLIISSYRWHICFYLRAIVHARPDVLWEIMIRKAKWRHNQPMLRWTTLSAHSGILNNLTSYFLFTILKKIGFDIMKPNYKLCLSTSCADKRPRPLRDLGYKDTIKVIFSFSGISYFKIGHRRDKTCLGVPTKCDSSQPARIQGLVRKINSIGE